MPITLDVSECEWRMPLNFSRSQPLYLWIAQFSHILSIFCLLPSPFLNVTPSNSCASAVRSTYARIAFNMCKSFWMGNKLIIHEYKNHFTNTQMTELERFMPWNKFSPFLSASTHMLKRPREFSINTTAYA